MVSFTLQTKAQRGWGHVDQVYAELCWHKTLGCSTTAWSPQGRRSGQEHPLGWKAAELISFSPPGLEGEHPEKGTPRPRYCSLRGLSSALEDWPMPIVPITPATAT